AGGRGRVGRGVDAIEHLAGAHVAALAERAIEHDARGTRAHLRDARAIQAAGQLGHAADVTGGDAHHADFRWRHPAAARGLRCAAVALAAGGQREHDGRQEKPGRDLRQTCSHGSVVRSRMGGGPGTAGRRKTASIYMQGCMYSRGAMARRSKEDALATRTALLDAAERVFLAQGVAGTSLNDIAVAAGTTRGAIYWHFRDKADLLNAMMYRGAMPPQQAMSLLEEAEGAED